MSTRFKGTINIDIKDSTPDWEPYAQPVAPGGTPNVLYVVLDDVGFAAMESFGGLIETPNIKRIADRGLLYTNFHTTALCSPTRSCLLTGRNHTTNSMACITEAASGFPNASGHIPGECAMIPAVLGELGWNTYIVGKWHLCPEDEMNMASTKKDWPLGRGFERFYGFLGAETNQWYPDLTHDNHPVDPPGLPEDGYHFSVDITAKALSFIKDAKVVAPDKPFFLYYAFGAAHAPHHAPTEWSDKYKGTFDMGYEAYRELVFANQRKLGIIPEHAELSPINPYTDLKGESGQDWGALDVVRPWDSLNDDEKHLFVRMAEVYAGFLSHADDQLGRVLDYLETSGQLDNTLIVLVSDNGASGEGGPNGSFNEWRFFNGVADTTEATIPHIDELGTPQSYNHYCTGWAWAFDTPFPYWKRWAGYEGGVADMCVIAWPKKIKPSKEVRHQYIHAVDIVPTVYDLLGIEPPAVIKGYTQNAIEGESFAASLTDPNAPGKQTQFYAMLGQRSIYHQGWLACTVHPPISGWGKFDNDEWELYDLEHDRAQSKNVAAQDPERLETLKRLWFYYAGIYNG